MDAVTTKSVLESYLALVREFPLYAIKMKSKTMPQSLYSNDLETNGAAMKQG